MFKNTYFNKFIFVLILNVLALSIISFGNEGRIFSGKITALGKGISDVVVTDGVNFTLTNNYGRYKINTSDDAKFIYYILPKGYNSPVIKGVTTFFRKITNEVQNDKYDFELEKKPSNDQKHTFIVWADPQIIDIKELIPLEIVAKDVNITVKEYQSNNFVHGICCGDIVFDRSELFEPFLNVEIKTEIPFYHLVGNHDLDYTNTTNETSTKSYENIFGPPYYSYNIGKIHFIVINDVFYYGYSYHYMGYIDNRQMEWIKNDLKYVPINSTIVLSLHIPTKYVSDKMNPSLIQLQKNSVVNANALYNLFDNYNLHILAGHSHTQWNSIISDKIFEHTHAAASAAWWQGEICLDGTPKGYTVYEVDGDKLTWYFKGVGKHRTNQFKAYNTGYDKENIDYFIANVYNYDNQWKVEWMENSVLQGKMEQYWGVDPDAHILYEPGKNKKYTWLSYEATNHLFRAKPKDINSTIEIVVTDRFGSVYKQKINNF